MPEAQNDFIAFNGQETEFTDAIRDPILLYLAGHVASR